MSPTLPERIDGVHALIVTPFILACLIAGAVMALILWQQQRPRRNPFAAPTDVQQWREKNWGRRDA